MTGLEEKRERLRREKFARNGRPKSSTNGTGHKPDGGPDPFDPGINLDDLLDADLPEPQFVIPRVLPEGLSVLAGRPKSGKSWLAMLHAICTAGGLACFGERVQPRPVLHLALEDTRCRYRDRARKMVSAIGPVDTSRLNIRTSWPRAGSGGLTRIGEWLSDNRGGLVVVDTLARFRDPSKGRNSYEEDYRAVSELKTLADTYGAAIEVITHTRKSAAEDPFDEVSGTLGINGAADGLMVLDRQRGADLAALYLTGRDLPDETLTLSWNKDAGLWSLDSRVDGIERAEKSAAPSKVDKCISFLRGCLTVFAFPDAEVVEGAKQRGYSFDVVKLAKARLRKEDPPLVSRKRGFPDGAWWNWIGHESKPDRPQEALDELLQHQNHQNHQNGES